MKTGRWIPLALGSSLLAFTAIWWSEVRAFSQLGTCAQIRWATPDHFPWIPGSKWWPFGRIGGFALQEPPRDPGKYANALGHIHSIDRMMVFSFGKVDPSVWDAFRRIEIREVLDLNYTSADDVAFASFENAGSIDHLIISDTSITYPAIKNLSRFPRLEKLTITGINLEREIIDEIVKLPRLKHCYLLGRCSPELHAALLALEKDHPGLILEWDSPVADAE